jgi:hypothetical protein
MLPEATREQYGDGMGSTAVMKRLENARDMLGIAPTEQIVMACVANPRGTMGATVIGGAAGGAVGVPGAAALIGGGVLGGALIGGLAGVGATVGIAVRSKMDEKAVRAQRAGGLADAWPGGRQLLAITSAHLIVCPIHKVTGKFTHIAASWPHAAISRIDVENTKGRTRFDIVFADGTNAGAESTKSSGGDQLAEVSATIWR